MVKRLKEYYRGKAIEVKTNMPSLEMPQREAVKEDSMGASKSVLPAPRSSDDAAIACETSPKRISNEELEELYKEYTGAAEAGFTQETFLTFIRKLDPQGYKS